MRQKSVPEKEPATEVVKKIRRATRRHFSAEDKIRIVLEGLRGEDSIAELCRREGIVQNLYYRWSKDFLEAGKKRLAGDTARAATSDEVKDLRREAGALKEVVAELTLENRLLKKSVTGDGGGEEGDTPHPRRPRSSSWRSNRPSRSSGRWRSSASQGRPSIVGTISIKVVAAKPWPIARLGQIASGTGFLTRCTSGSSSSRSTSRHSRRASSLH